MVIQLIGRGARTCVCINGVCIIEKIIVHHDLLYNDRGIIKYGLLVKIL